MKKNTKKIVNEEKLVNNKAYFYQRLIAYLLDMFIISMVASIISQPFIDLKTTEKLQKEATEIIEKYEKNKISAKTYVYQTLDLNYQIAKTNGVYSLTTIVLLILYFVVFQFYYKGQTFGKKIMNIRIVKYDRTTLTINDLIFRSLIINSIFLNMLTFALMVFATRDIYGYGTIFLELIQYIILIAIFIMAAFRKDGRGLHDLIANTIVVKKDILESEECKA